MIADTLSNKSLNPVVTELFIWRRKLNVSLVFIMQSYFAVPKNIRLNSTYYFIMNIPNKPELQQIAFNRSSNIDFKDFMNLYKKCTAKPCSFLIITATLASDNCLFQKELFRKKIKFTDEKLQYDINREAAKISALTSGNIDQYEYLTGEEILPFDQKRVIEQAKFTYSSLRKAFEKQRKTIEDQGIKRVESLKALKSEEGIESIEGLFLQKIWKLMKLKMKYMKSKNCKKKLNEKI